MMNQIKKLFKKIKRSENDSSLRESIEELIEESQESARPFIQSDERELLGNVLNLTDLTAYDVMVPRAEIIGVLDNVSYDELLDIFIKTSFSRLPVYRDNLDHVIGMIEIKDILRWHKSKKQFDLKELICDVLFISPTMRTLDLILQMRQSGCKLSIIVDEYGGVDGLLTFSRLIEEIIGDIQDAHDFSPKSQIIIKENGIITADGRTTLEELDDIMSCGLRLSDLHQDIDTLNGLVVFLAGRVPVLSLIHI
jgi:magnesium and cobalt transporter